MSRMDHDEGFSLAEFREHFSAHRRRLMESGIRLKPGVVELLDFLARRGSLPLSLLMGPFVAYCNFNVSVLDHPQGVQIVVQRNFPWWAGWSGVRGARRAAQKLADASAVIGQHPMALQLRFLQTLTEVASENNSTTIFPLPIDLITPFLKAPKA